MKAPHVYTLLYHGSQHSEISGEFSLPDYLPDVRRILRVKADPHITGKYMNGERLEFEGEVSMTLIYLSEEQTVCAFSAAIPFSQNAAVAGLDESTVITARLHADNSACRLMGPRKCVLRTRPTLRIRAAAKMSTVPDTQSLPDANALCTDSRPIPTADLICISRDALRYSEDIACADGAIVSVLSCDVTPCVRECRVSAGHVVCKGEFLISALCSVMTDGDTACRALTSRVPFSESLDGEGVTEEHRCEPDLTVISVTPTVTEEGHNLGVDFCCDAAVICSSDSTADIITDAFLPTADVRVQGEPHTVFRPLKTVYGTCNVSGSLSHDPQEPLGSVLDCRMRPTLDRYESKDGRLLLDGSAEVSLICLSADGKYLPLTGSFPLHWETDGAGLPDAADLLIFSDCTATAPSMRIDPSANTVICDAELSVCLSLSAKETYVLPRALTVAQNSPTYTPPTEPLILCYPEEGEQLWDIAKRYRIPPQTIRRANHLDGGKIAKASPLVIPIHPLFADMKA